jgi:hypothetical protein
VGYHENTIDKDKIKDDEFVEGIEYKDLFADNQEYLDVINNSLFHSILKDDERVFDPKDLSLNQHSKFFVRKVLSVYDAMINNPEEEIICWVDSDCLITAPFISTVKKNIELNPFDIWHINREHKDLYSDTYFIIFNTSNKEVRDFITSWYNLFTSNEVFELECWADHCTFDHLRKSSELKIINQLSDDLGFAVRHKLGHKQNKYIREGSSDFFIKRFKEIDETILATRRKMDSAYSARSGLSLKCQSFDETFHDEQYAFLCGQRDTMKLRLQSIDNDIELNRNKLISKLKNRQK